MGHQKTKFKQTEIGMIPEDWEIKQIKDLVMINEFSIGKNFQFKDIEYIDIDSVDNGIIKNIQLLKLNDAPSRAKRIVRKNDIIISTVRPNLKHFAFIKEAKPNTIVSTGFAVISPKKINPRFLYYFITTSRYTNYLTAIADSHTSTYPSFNPDVIENSIIPFPNEAEQFVIAKILSSLDSKIELNQQMNKTLEAIGQAIFKRWFVDFEFPNEKDKPYKSSGGEMIDSEMGKIPKGWKTSKLGDNVITVKGCSYRSEDLEESDIALVTLKSINRGGGFNQEGYKEYSGEYREEQVLYDGDIVVAQTDITQNAEVVGRPAIVNPLGKYSKLIASLDLQIIKPKKLPKSYLYYLLKTEDFHNHAIAYTNGTTVLHLNKNAVPEYVFVLPSDNVQILFDNLIGELLQKYQENEKQIAFLSQIRDLLLPKLMSGKIRVPVEVKA